MEITHLCQIFGDVIMYRSFAPKVKFYEKKKKIKVRFNIVDF